MTASGLRSHDASSLPAQAFRVRPDEQRSRVMSRPDVRSAMQAALPGFLAPLGPVLRSEIGRRLSAYADQRATTTADAEAAWALISGTELALHESAHLAGIYLFEHAREVSSSVLYLPGHPNLSSDAAAAVSCELPLRHRTIISLLAPLLSPNLMPAPFSFTCKEERFSTGDQLSDQLSDQDRYEIGRVQQAVREQTGGAGNQDDIGSTCALLDRHQAVLRACACVLAELILGAMWAGETQMDSELLFRHLKPIARRGQCAPPRPWSLQIKNWLFQFQKD